MKFKGDVIITDPCYLVKDEENGFPDSDDWNKCDNGDNLQALGFENFLCESTGYGDWSCTVFNTDTKEKLGEFCADAGLVCVILLSDVLKYNPNFDYHKTKQWTTTLIRDFDGDIEIERQDDDNAKVVGKGNINFFSQQTGF